MNGGWNSEKRRMEREEVHLQWEHFLLKGNMSYAKKPISVPTVIQVLSVLNPTYSTLLLIFFLDFFVLLFLLFLLFSPCLMLGYFLFFVVNIYCLLVSLPFSFRSLVYFLFVFCFYLFRHEPKATQPITSEAIFAGPKNTGGAFFRCRGGHFPPYPGKKWTANYTHIYNFFFFFFFLSLHNKVYIFFIYNF